VPITPALPCPSDRSYPDGPTIREYVANCNSFDTVAESSENSDRDAPRVPDPSTSRGRRHSMSRDATSATIGIVSAGVATGLINRPR
jgi:hypothetical protein